MSYDLWINKNNIITKYIEIFKNTRNEISCELIMNT